MEEYLVDRETLGKFVDELIKKKALPVDNAEELNQLREEAIKSLDEKISEAIFGQLNEEQTKALNQMFDAGDKDEDAFREFFVNAGVDMEKVMTEAMQQFGAEFLGGENA